MDQECQPAARPSPATRGLIRDKAAGISGEGQHRQTAGSVQSKIAAARKRDEIDANLTALHSKVEGVVVPEVEDVYVANVAAFLTAGGVKVTPDIKRLIAADGDDFLRTVRGRQAGGGAAGESMRSSDLRVKYRAWCEVRSEVIGTEKAFWDFMRSRFTHDANNGRPRYLGVRPKRSTPTLTLVPRAA